MLCRRQQYRRHCLQRVTAAAGHPCRLCKRAVLCPKKAVSRKKKSRRRQILRHWRNQRINYYLSQMGILRSLQHDTSARGQSSSSKEQASKENTYEENYADLDGAQPCLLRFIICLAVSEFRKIVIFQGPSSKAIFWRPGTNKITITRSRLIVCHDAWGENYQLLEFVNCRLQIYFLKVSFSWCRSTKTFLWKANQGNSRAE